MITAKKAKKMAEKENKRFSKPISIYEVYVQIKKHAEMGFDNLEANVRVEHAEEWVKTLTKLGFRAGLFENGYRATQIDPKKVYELEVSW